MGTGTSFSNVFGIIISLTGIILSILAGNYVAAIWAFVAFLGEIQLLVKDQTIRELRERNG